MRVIERYRRSSAAVVRGTILAIVVLSCRDGATDPGAPADEPLREVLRIHGVTPLGSAPARDPALVRLGQALMFDKILSGNRDVSCATCHHPTFASGDGLSLSIGTGGSGSGSSRGLGTARQFIARNAQALFNLGHPGSRTMFWDGRVVLSSSGAFETPAGGALPPGLSSALAAQAMFPVTDRLEMRGHPGDRAQDGTPNELAQLDDADLPAIWRGLMARLLAVQEYIALFQAAYPAVPAADLGFEHAANAIAAFEAQAFASADSPFDRYVAGDDGALSDTAKEGALLFFGRARCSECHTGPLLTDQRFHNIAVPQIGPGRGAASPEDHGRGGVTGAAVDRFGFRTPALRNVALTGPWMHDGAYATLRAAVRHYVNATLSLRLYDVSQLGPDLRATHLNDAAAISAILATLDTGVTTAPGLSEAEVDRIVVFLEALTDPATTDLGDRIPSSVPSGLPVGD